MIRDVFDVYGVNMRPVNASRSPPPHSPPPPPHSSSNPGPVVDPCPAGSCCWQGCRVGLTDLWPQVTASGLTLLALKRDENYQSLSGWMHITGNSKINTHERLSVFSLSLQIISQLYFAGFSHSVQSGCCVREARWVSEVSVVRRPHHKQWWSASVCHPVCDPRERCLWTLRRWNENEKNSSSL